MKKDIETSPQSTRDHSPKPKRMKKRREHEIHSDDSDTIPLSKLKSPTPIIQSKRKRAEAFHDKLNRRGIASTNPTPKSNGPKSGQRPSGPKKNSTKAKEKPPLSSDVWKVLQEKGWVYRTGPEPFNKGKRIILMTSSFVKQNDSPALITLSTLISLRPKGWCYTSWHATRDSLFSQRSSNTSRREKG